MKPEMLPCVLLSLLLAACNNDAAMDAETHTETEKKKKALDLSVPQTAPDSNASIVLEEEKMLPDLFKESESSRNAKLSGKPIINAESQDYMHSVEGAEISLEVKTQ